MLWAVEVSGKRKRQNCECRRPLHRFLGGHYALERLRVLLLCSVLCGWADEAEVLGVDFDLVGRKKDNTKTLSTRNSYICSCWALGYSGMRSLHWPSNLEIWMGFSITMGNTQLAIMRPFDNQVDPANWPLLLAVCCPPEDSNIVQTHWQNAWMCLCFCPFPMCAQIGVLFSDDPKERLEDFILFHHFAKMPRVMAVWRL